MSVSSQKASWYCPQPPPPQIKSMCIYLLKRKEMCCFFLDCKRNLADSEAFPVFVLDNTLPESTATIWELQNHPKCSLNGWRACSYLFLLWLTQRPPVAHLGEMGWIAQYYYVSCSRGNRAFISGCLGAHFPLSFLSPSLKHYHQHWCPSGMQLWISLGFSPWSCGFS